MKGEVVLAVVVRLALIVPRLLRLTGWRIRRYRKGVGDVYGNETDGN